MDGALAGKEYPTVEFAVAPDRVIEFSRAVGERSGDIPPTFATVPEIAAIGQVIEDPELGLNFARVVHAEQEYEWRRPFTSGEVLRVTPRIASIRAKGGHEFLVIETEMRDGSGKPVVFARDTLVVRAEGPR